MSADGVTFGTLYPDGRLEDVRVIQHDAIAACPWTIFMAEHYREDGSCRCTDPTATVMLEWGYAWDDEAGQWIAGEEDEDA